MVHNRNDHGYMMRRIMLKSVHFSCESVRGVQFYKIHACYDENISVGIQSTYLELNNYGFLQELSEQDLALHPLEGRYPLVLPRLPQTPS